jgi:4-amino-4-deoxy-L-arabinose transferase-like glycosyltransferase
LIKKYWPYAVLAIFTVAGFLLRIYQLTWQCLNVDEVTTSEIANNTVSWIVHYSLTTDYNPPLYYLIVHYSFIFFQETSRFSVRFPAVIFGTLAIPIAYFVAKEIRGVTPGLLVAGLMSFMFPFYYYSQNARAYSLVLFMFMGFSYFFVRKYNGDRSVRTTVGLGIFTAFCLWSHYYSLIPITIMGLILFLKDRRSTIHAGIISLILLSPMAFLFDFAQIKTRTLHVGPLDYFWMMPKQMLIYLPNELLCWSWLVLVPLAIYSCIRYRNVTIIRDLGIVVIITAGLLIPLTALTGCSPRYALLVSPLILMVAMYPISAWIDGLRTATQKIAIFLLVLGVVFLFNYGSLVQWTSFSFCPYMMPNGAEAV